MKEEKKQKKEIDVREKDGKDLIKAYAEVSKSIQEIYEYFDKYDNSEESIEKYKKDKNN